MINVDHLSFSYNRKKKTVLEDLNLTMEEGRIIGLLGRNGAGKSTLLYLLAGLMTPSEGRVCLDGLDVRSRKPETLNKLFIVPEEFDLPGLSLKKYIKLNAPFYPNFSEQELKHHLEVFELTDDLHIGELSMGQKKKVLISFALATNTQWLFMDEPTNGLDIPGKSQFRKLVINEMSDTRSMVISTHQVKDMENLIDHVMILEQKGILLNASVNEICRKLCFKPSDTPPGESAWSSMPTFHGYSIMKPNTENEDTELNLELLFNGALAHPDEMRHLFTT